MNHFHRQRLLSGIRDSHQVPVQADWAYAIRKQARLILLPLFRELIVSWRNERTGTRPIISELALELLLGFFKSGSIHLSVHAQLEQVISKFLQSLSKKEIGILKFYFLSKEREIGDIFQEVLDSDESEDTTLEEDEKETGKRFLDRIQQLDHDELIGFLMGEVGEIENIFSNLEVETDALDTQSIELINESFSDYLDLPYGEISLIQKPVEEWDFWEKVTAEEPETVGKRINTESGLEWAECWLLPNGELKPKGNLEDPADRDQAAIQSIRQELTVILNAVQEQLIQHYGLSDSQIHYTFFTKRESLENVIPGEGIQFFVDQIEVHGSDDFEPGINLDIRRYQHKTLQEWGTQISLDITERYWGTEDEQYEFKVWVFSVEREEIPLETRFSEDQKEAIILTILGHIHHTYHLDYESK